MKWLALLTIRLYQRTISRVLPPSCRFVPSCSEYGYEAITRYGIIRGGVMAAWRVMRCNPWGGHGYDPVPDRNESAVAGRQSPEERPPNLGAEGERLGSNPQSAVLMPPNGHPQSFNDFALTPHAPGRSLTEGIQ